MINRDVLLTVGARLVILVVGFGSGILTARFLGPHGRGQYYFVTTIAALFSQFGNLGLQTSNVYIVARKPDLLGPLLSNSFVGALLVGSVLGGSAIAVIKLFGIEAEHASSSGLWWAILIAPSSLFFLLGSNLLVGIRRIGLFNAFQVAGNTLVLLGIAAAGVLGAGPFGFLVGVGLAWLIAALALAWVLARHAKGDKRPSLAVFKQGFRYAVKVYLVTLLGFLVLRSGVFFVREQSGATNLGYYSIASQLADVIAILPSSVALVLFPELLRQQVRHWHTTRRSLALVASLLAVGCGCAAWLAYPGITLVFGARYAPAVPVFLWMLPSAFFLGSTSILSQYLAAAGFPRALIPIWGAAFLVMLVVSALLVPRLGGVGAAAALSLSHMVLFALVAVLCARTARSRLEMQSALS